MSTDKDVDAYIASFDGDIRERLEGVRAALHAGIPDGEEKVRYQMPAILLGGRYAVHFAAWKKHIGMYPVAVAGPDLEPEIAPHRVGKDSVNFLYTEPVPYELITRIAEFLYAQHVERASK